MVLKEKDLENLMVMNGINQALGSMVDAVNMLADSCNVKADSNVVDFRRRINGVKIEESLARISRELRAIISEYSVGDVDKVK